MSEHHGGYDPHVGYASGEKTSFNMEWYDKLRASKPNWKKVSTQRVEAGRGIAVHAKAGQVIKFIQPEGPNIIDVWWLNENIKDASGERYEVVYTAGLEGFILRKNSRLWSTVPYFRPIATYIDDNLDPATWPDKDAWPVWHGGHCSPELIEAAYGKLNHISCHTGALEAALSVGLDENIAALPNMCIFQPMSIKNSKTASGNISPNWHATAFNGKPGSFVEYYAEIDLLILVTHCPYGNQSKACYEAEHFPIDTEVWDTGIKPQPRPKFHDWRPAFYKRMERLKAAGNTGPTKRTFDED